MTSTRPIDRLIAYLNSKEISAYKAEKELEVGNGYLKNSSKRNGGIGSEILDKIHKQYIDLNLIWLITGEGEMLKSGQKDADTPTQNNQLAEQNETYTTNTPVVSRGGGANSDTKRDTPSDAPKTILNPQFITVDSSGNENISYVPVKAAAGYLNGYSDREYMEKLPTFSLPGLTDASYRAFQVDGDSMFPTLENGEMVIGRWVEKLDYIREDRVHIIVTKNDGVLVKRLLNRIDKYGYVVAKSDAVDNRNLYPNIETYPEDIVEVWYAVWHGSFTFKSPTEMYKRVNNIEADLTEVLRILKQNNLMT